MNEIQERGYISVDEKQVDNELFLVGDYKVNHCEKFNS